MPPTHHINGFVLIIITGFAYIYVQCNEYKQQKRNRTGYYHKNLEKSRHEPQSTIEMIKKYQHTQYQTDKFGKMRPYLKIHEEDNFPASTTVYSVHFLASWVVYQVIVTGMQRLSCIDWIQGNFVTDNHLEETDYSNYNKHLPFITNPNPCARLIPMKILTAVVRGRRHQC